MKKIILTLSCLAAVSSYALPTYEPFTEAEYVNAIIAEGTNTFVAIGANGVAITNASGYITNGVDLCTGGFTAPTGEVWGNLNFTGTFGTNIRGLDISVISNSSLFTTAALTPLLPSTFPGFPAAGGAISYMIENPAQPLIAGAASANIVGNSAVLTFSQDILPPASGSKTFYVSYLYLLAQAGQLGGGNDARYLNFVASSNLVEGTGTSGFYKTWSAMLDTLNTTTACKFFAHSVIAGGSGYYNIPCDATVGKEFTTSAFTSAYANVQFVVAAYTMNASGSDVQTMWVNPTVSSFGGATPPASPIDSYNMPYKMSDIGGMVVSDRPGHGALAGGLGTNYMANLILGSTWSYVTGGPEFTTQPPSGVISAPGQTVTMSAAALAAGQSVNYQWQHNGTNVNNGANGASGGANVTGANLATLTLTGVSGGDAGVYQVVASASSTGFSLVSSNVTVIVSDPGVLAQPQPTVANAGGTASFSATVETTTSGLSYAWYNGSTMLANGVQADNSTATGAAGTLPTTGTKILTLTLSNVTCAEDGSYTLVVTNALNSTSSTTAASLTVTDPYISVQPPALVGIAAGDTTVFTVTAQGTGLTYQWNWNNGNGANVNNGEILGATTSALTITSANTANDAGTYSCTVSGTCGSPQTSSNSTVVVATAPSAVAVTPANWVQQVGTHLALVANVTGASGFVQFYLQFNGTNITPGVQADGSTITGPGAVIGGSGISAMVLSNLQLLDSGTYTVIASNVAGMASGSTVVKVVPQGQLTLSSNNLVVIRVGDGAQPLSGATGNTLYLDQFTTSGGYSNTIMVPDTGPSAIVVAGAAIASGNEGAEEGYLTLSSNQQFLNFGGFCYSYPYAGADVTAGAVGNVRGIYALDAVGIMELVYTNYGLYSGGNGFRDVYSTDGLTNFWTTGSASGGTVKYVNAGPAGAAYTITSPGQGIPGLPGTPAPAPNSGGVCLGLNGTNLVFSDNSTDGDSSVPGVWGLDQFTQGAPKVVPGPYNELLPGNVGHADDFAFSPDGNTVYLADDDVTSGSSGNGGIQRWDNVGGTWTYAYNIYDTSSPNGTNGTRGLTVYWPPSITTWGSGVEGAVLYATTSEVTANRIIQITDNAGAASTSTVLVTCASNQFFRGIRFGPVTVPIGCTAGESTSSAVVGQEVQFAASVTGVYSYYFPNAAGTGYNLISPIPTTYQWYRNGAAIPGATGFAYGFSNVQTSNAGTYTFVVSSSIAASVTNSPGLVLAVNPFTLTSDLVGWFKLSDGSGTNAADSSVYGDTGALMNFPADNSEWVPGLGGADALNFANVDTNNDNAVVAADAPQLNFTNNLAFTLAAWVNAATNSEVGGAGVIAKGFGAGGEQYCVDIIANPAGFPNTVRLFVRNAAGTSTVLASTNQLPVGQWEHIAATYDGNAGIMAIYLNGQLVTNLTTAPSSLLYTAYPVSIGNRPSGAGTPYNLPFLGEMQDARIYSIALGAQDIQAVYQVLAPPVAPNPVSYSKPAVTGQPGAPVLHFTGTASATYHVWTTTNLSLQPIETKWTLLGTGTFSGGADTFACPVGGSSAQFYAITQP